MLVSRRREPCVELCQGTCHEGGRDCARIGEGACSASGRAAKSSETADNEPTDNECGKHSQN